MPPEAPPSLLMACGSQSNLGIRLRRRIFVQTDDGSVLGMEVHRNDKVHSIKKKVQELLRVPTEQSALSFGDLVLQDDVHELRCDSPVLLTSELHRSWSTPCFCPKSGSSIAHRRPDDEDGEDEPFEIVGGWSCCTKIRRLIDESTKAIRSGVEPVRAQGGLGGAYYFKNRNGDKVAIVKPADEEPLAPNNPRGFVGRRLGQAGLSRSIRVGETGVREVAAYLLDHGHFAKVPATVLVKASHPIFHLNGKKKPASKIGSFQEYVEHDYDASECGSSRFPASSVHRIGILDTRLFNTDRHSGNMLVRHVTLPFCSSPAFSSGDDSTSTATASSTSSSVCSSPIAGAGLVDLIPIDHGLCLPESLEDPYFEWLHWPQASFPFSEEELEYIRKLDAAKDADMLRKQLPMLKEACIRMMVLCTRFLQLAAEAGLCLADVGSMMTRELGDDGVTCRSQLERLCMQAKALAAEQQQQQQQHCADSSSKEDNDELFDMDMESDKDNLCPSPCKRLLYTSRSLPVTRAAVIDEEEETEEALTSTRLSFSVSPKPRRRSRRLGSGVDEGAGTLALSGMNEREWASFLEYVVALSGEAFAKHKEQQGLLVGVHRLGTSCQF